MNEKLHRRLLFESARLLKNRQAKDYHSARIRAARTMTRGWVHPSDLPHPRQIRDLLQQLEAGGWPDITAAEPDPEEQYDAFYRLLAPLACVSQNRRSHPEGDVLYHSLQVFELLCDQLPFDTDLLLAGLLHDVGRGLDPKNHVESGLNALSGLISERTAWLLQNNLPARGLIDGSIGARARRRLVANESFDELEILVRADLEGRQAGMRVRDLEDALTYVFEVEREFD